MVSSLQGTLASDMAPDFQNLVHQNPQTMLNCLVDAVHSADLATLQGSVRAAIKHEQLPPEEFLHRISESQQIDVLRGCLLVHILSLGTKVPREFQLEAILGPLDGRDAVVSSATGSGKTMIMILLLLLRPKEHAILIVPLKRLQQAQVSHISCVP
jgi:ATP-dependent helicase YprA (DUF1998 family)